MAECSHPQVSILTRLSGPALRRCLLCGEILNTEAEMEGLSSILGGQAVTPTT